MPLSRSTRRTATFCAAALAFFLGTSFLLSQEFTGGGHAFDSRILGSSWQDRLGTSVLVLEDLNQDGVPEYAVGIPESNYAGAVSATSELDFTGVVYLYSGFDGSRMQRILGPGASSRFGTSLARLPSQSTDPEFLIGAPDLESGTGLPVGGVHRVTLSPMLRSTSLSISAFAGGSLTYHIDFPDSFAGHKALMLASIEGSGGVGYNGVRFPIGITNLWFRSTEKPYLGPVTTLDAQGNATVTLVYAPGELALGVGKHIEVCASGLDPIGSLPLIASTQSSFVILP